MNADIVFKKNNLVKADELEQLIYLQTVKSSQSMKVKSSSMKENSTIDFYVKVTRPFY